MTISVGVVTLWATSYHQKMLDDYYTSAEVLKQPPCPPLLRGIKGEGDGAALPACDEGRQAR
jgi:hypothetical protein